MFPYTKQEDSFPILLPSIVQIFPTVLQSNFPAVVGNLTGQLWKYDDDIHKEHTNKQQAISNRTNSPPGYFFLFSPTGSDHYTQKEYRFIAK